MFTPILEQIMTALKFIDMTENGFVFDPCTGESYTLNSCGQLVLKRLQTGETSQQIVEFFIHQFGIDKNTAERDIADFFQQINLFGLTEENA